ncbi:hypothetical protein NPJ82_09750 [Sphingomonas sp. NY01]|uniref:hypothetical protein n=1 Tax=Sphingomonas sp. NY01 TaxID=2968057 RepID=UPI00315D40ED
MTTDKTAIIRCYTEAVAQMLVGSRAMKPGAAILAGEMGGAEGRRRMGAIAHSSGNDLVYLDFADGEDGYHLTDITLCAVRDGICHLQTDCRLYLSRNGSRAIILPQPGIRKAYRLAPGELIQMSSQPADRDEGIARAEVRLTKLVARGVAFADRAAVRTRSLAA